MKQTISLPIIAISLLTGCNLPAVQPAAENTPEPPTATQNAPVTVPAATSEPTLQPEATSDASLPTATPVLTIAVPSTPTPIVEGPVYGEIIYQTDFQSGWPDIPSDKGTVSVTAGGYQFDLQPNWALWAYTAVVDRGEFYMESSVSPMICPEGRGGYGLMFHYLSSDQFRYFIITCDGRFVLFERALPEGVSLASGTLPDTIDMASPSHILGVRVASSTAYLYVDSVEVGTAPLSDTPEGDIGLYVESGGQALTILFSQLSVYEP